MTDPNPVDYAAKNPNIAVLRSLLQDEHLTPNVDDCILGPLNLWSSPLTTAILANHPAHVDLLLSYGANPNGFCSKHFRTYSCNFIRGRSPDQTHSWPVGPIISREEVLHSIEIPQCEPLSTEELIARFNCRSRFWSEPDYPSISKPAYVKPPMTALEAAARIGSPSIIDRLLQSGADIQAWITQDVEIPPLATTSHLSVSTPLHRAIESENEETIRYLLDQNFKPDIFPLVPITRSLNAAMYTIIKEPPNLRALEILAPFVDFSLRTPIYNCHILHFAIATLDLQIFKKVLKVTQTDPLTLEPTAIGHTLLHIACLPLDQSWINVHAPSIYASIHEVRILNDTWKAEPLKAPNSTTRAFGGIAALAQYYANSYPASENTPSLPSIYSAQSAVIQYLLSLPQMDAKAAISAKDFYGNTPLHYLASNRCPNEALLGELRALDDGGTWRDCKNAFGYSPEVLWEDGKEARKDWGKMNMVFWLE